MSWNRDERGVATVLGGIMMVALALMVLVMIRVNFVPQWEEETDAEQLQSIEDQLIQFRAVLDRQMDNSSSTPVTSPFELSAPGSAGILTAPKLPSTIDFEGTTAGVVQLSAGSILIHQQAGHSLAGLNEEWNGVATNGTVEDVVNVAHLRLRMADPESGDTDDGITLTITDANGDFAGSLRLYVEDFPSGYAIKAEVKSASGDVLYDDGESRFQQDQPAYYWLDALEPSLLFNQVLAAADAPMTLSLTETGVTGDYAITYLKQVGAGTVTIGGSGLRVDNYATSLGGGAMSVELRPQRLPDQTFVMEHGAVFRIQQDGTATFIGPAVSMQNTGTGTSLSIGLPMLNGDAVSRTGGAVPISLTSSSAISIQGQATNFTVRIESGYPLEWAAALEESAAAGELDPDDYQITTDATSVTLSISGPSADPDVYDVSLSLRQAAITATLQP